MNQDNEKEEPSVDEILSSIKDVIASDKEESINESDTSIDDNVFELTDIIEDIDENDSQDNSDSISEIFECLWGETKFRRSIRYSCRNIPKSINKKKSVNN